MVEDGLAVQQAFEPRTPRLFHGVVWSARALAAFDDCTELKDSLAGPPLWGEHVPQILLSTDWDPPVDTQNVFLPNGCRPSQIISPGTFLEDLRSLDFDKYCSQSVRSGIRKLQTIQGVQEMPLGIFAKLERVEDWFGAVQEIKLHVETTGSQFINWDVTNIDHGKCFCGPSFFQLANKCMILLGVDPRRILWLVSALKEEHIDFNSLDAQIALHCATFTDNEEPQPLCINIGPFPLPNKAPWSSVATTLRTGIDLTASDAEQQETARHLARRIAWTSPVSLHPRCSILLNKGDCLRRLHAHKARAQAHLALAVTEYRRVAGERLPWQDPEQSASDDEFKTQFFEDGALFDHRSGAVCFDAYEWELEVVRGTLSPEFRRIADYFSERIEVPWQRERPSYRRVLATPTKFLLRGEDYYTNLRNESPLARLQMILGNMDQALEVIPNGDCTPTGQIEWKLALGLLDQLRNVVLQLGWFDTSRGRIADLQLEMPDDFSDRVQELLERITRAYYHHVFGIRTAFADVLACNDSWVQVRDAVTGAIAQLREIVKQADAERFEWNLQTTKLIRRWREADHPGENALVALLAFNRWRELNPMASSSDCSMPTIGIGWGGIELPIVFRHVAHIVEFGTPPVFAAHYSAYARFGSRQPRVVPLSPQASLNHLQAPSYFIFDDNSLSGATLQVVVEHLWETYGAKPEAIFLTRYSGERRYDQMRMELNKRGGLLDPTLLKEDGLVQGFLGETPFSRSWSRDVYENPIGVFSLAKRRILELLFSNSSADRFDREGF